MSHRQGLHSDDKPYPGEELCYCDEEVTPNPTPTTLGEILDDYAQQYFLLLRNPTYEAKDIKDQKRVEATQSIKEQLKALLPEKLEEVEGDAYLGYALGNNHAIDQIEKAIEEWAK